MYFKPFALALTVSVLLGLQKYFPYRKLTPELFKKRRLNVTLATVNGLCLLILSPLILGLSQHTPSWIEVVSAILLFDLLAYLLHRLYHRVDFLFRFHQVHHSDPSLEVTSALRFHVLEVFPTVLIRLGLAHLFNFSWITLIIFEIAFQTLNLFEHSNLKLKENLSQVLGFVFVTPALHRKHHSIRKLERDSNYGTIFSFWDRCLGSFQASSEGQDIPMGLRPMAKEIGVLVAFKMPFVKAK